MATQIKDFLTTFADQEQIVPATDNKGTVTVTMPATANAGDIYPLEAFARDMSDRTVARATKNIMAVEPAIIQPKIHSPRHDSFVLNDTFQVTLEPYEVTPGYPGQHVSTTYQVTTEPDGQGEVLYEATSTTNLESNSITLSRPLGEEETAYLRVKVEDATLGDSEWSESHHIVGSYALPPTVLLPKKEAVVYYKQFTVSCEELKCAGGVIDNHVKTDWEITDIHGNQVIAQSLGNTTNLTSFTFTNASIPPDTWLAVNITYYGEQTGKSRTTKLVIKTSEKEAIIKPSVVFPTGYCHPKSFTAILSALKMLNMEEYNLEAARLKITSDKAGNTVLYDSGLKDSIIIEVNFPTARTPGETVYFWAYEKEELSGLDAWGEPQEVRICRPLAPIITRPDDMEYFVDFPVILDYLRTQGMTSDTQISSDYEIYNDDRSELLDSSYNKTENMNTWNPTLSEDLMGSYIIVRARQTGEYTGTTDWTEKRVLVHLPMTVFPPTIQTPVENGWIHPTVFDVVLGPFETENVDRPNHHASQIKITTDENGRDVIFTSSQFTNGDKRHYTVKLAKASLLPILYISARVEDSFAGWSEWSEPQPLQVTYPVQPTIDKPVANALLGIENILTAFSGYAMQGGIKDVAFAGVRVVIRDKNSNAVYFNRILQSMGENLVLPEAAREKQLRLTASYLGKDVLEGPTKTVDFRTRLVSPGYRIDGKATVIGLPDGEPFTVAGRKVFIAVADAMFRSSQNGKEFYYGTDGTDTVLPNVAISGTNVPNFVINGEVCGAVSNELAIESKMNSVLGSKDYNSDQNTRLLVSNYGNLQPSGNYSAVKPKAAQYCYDTVIGNLHFSLGCIGTMARVFTRAEYLDKRDPTISDELYQSRNMYDAVKDCVKPTAMTSTEVDSIYCWAIAGAQPLNNVISAKLPKDLATMVIPILELAVLDNETGVATLPVIKNISRVTYYADTKFSVQSTSVNPLNPVVKFRITTEGKTYTVDAMFGYAEFTHKVTTEDDLVIHATAILFDGTESAVGTGTFSVYVPILIPANDQFTVQQGKQLSITEAQIIANDKHDNAIAELIIESTVGLTVQKTGTQYVVKPTAHYGQNCLFTYRLKDSTGSISKTTGSVNINLTMLDDTYAHVYNTAKIMEMVNSDWQPMSPEQIFNHWARFDNNAYFPNKESATGAAKQWEMTGAGKFRCTENTVNSITGFLSPDKLDNYDHTVILSSTDSDDDSIFLILAFARINNVNHILAARRSGSGNHVAPQIKTSGFGITYNVGGTGNLIVASPRSDLYFTNWAGKSTAVRAVREGDIFKVSASPCKVWGQTTPVINKNSELVIDINDYPNLAWAKGPTPYGYACYSQKFSSFDDPMAAVDGTVLFNKDNGDVWRYKNGAWSLSNEKMWDVLDWPRYVYNPFTGEKFLVTENAVVLTA